GSVVGAGGRWYALPVPAYRAPVAASIAGVLHTAPPSSGAGTVYSRHRSAPVAASSAITAPRRRTFASCSSATIPEMPTYTEPFHTTGLLYVSASPCDGSRNACQRIAPWSSVIATTCGPRNALEPMATYTTPPSIA